MSAGVSQNHTAIIVGVGLIGGSVGLALRAQGWTVIGVEADPVMAARAVELGAIDRIGVAAIDVMVRASFPPARLFGRWDLTGSPSRLTISTPVPLIANGSGVRLMVCPAYSPPPITT